MKMHTSLKQRCLLTASALLLATAMAASPAHAASPDVIVGGNINERFTWATPRAMDQTHTRWVRGFIPMSEFMDGSRSYSSDPGLQALKDAAASGRKIVLSLKWDATGKGHFGRMPTAGSPKEQQAFAVVDQLLDATSGSVSILVLTNELSIDTAPEDLVPDADGRLPVIAFLRRLAAHVAAEHRQAADGTPLPLYAGGMTRLDLAKTEQSIPTRLMIRWVNEDPNITGADFHLHQPDIATTAKALAFMHASVTAKPMIVTEMSLVFKWKQHLGDRIDESAAGAAFANRYHVAPGTRVDQFFTNCFAAPVPPKEWQDFLAAQPWFEPHYLKNIAPMLHANGVTLATYALTLNPQPTSQTKSTQVTQATVPWFLNALLVPGLVAAPGPTRLPENEGFFGDYLELQGK